jgi:hypothetical protein
MQRPDERTETTAGICSGHVWSDPRRKKKKKKRRVGAEAERGAHLLMHSVYGGVFLDGRVTVLDMNLILSFALPPCTFLVCFFLVAAADAELPHQHTRRPEWVGGFSFLMANNFCFQRKCCWWCRFSECNDINRVISFTCKRLGRRGGATNKTRRRNKYWCRVYPRVMERDYL